MKAAGGAAAMTDGSQKTAAKGVSYTIPAGHDAWVEGDEPFVAIEVMSAEQYARRQRMQGQALGSGRGQVVVDCPG